MTQLVEVPNDPLVYHTIREEYPTLLNYLQFIDSRFIVPLEKLLIVIGGEGVELQKIIKFQQDLDDSVSAYHQRGYFGFHQPPDLDTSIVDTFLEFFEITVISYIRRIWICHSDTHGMEHFVSDSCTRLVQRKIPIYSFGGVWQMQNLDPELLKNIMVKIVREYPVISRYLDEVKIGKDLHLQFPVSDMKSLREIKSRFHQIIEPGNTASTSVEDRGGELRIPPLEFIELQTGDTAVMVDDTTVLTSPKRLSPEERENIIVRWRQGEFLSPWDLIVYHMAMEYKSWYRPQLQFSPILSQT